MNPQVRVGTPLRSLGKSMLMLADDITNKRSEQQALQAAAANRAREDAWRQQQAAIAQQNFDSTQQLNAERLTLETNKADAELRAKGIVPDSYVRSMEIPTPTIADPSILRPVEGGPPTFTMTMGKRMLGITAPAKFEVPKYDLAQGGYNPEQDRDLQKSLLEISARETPTAFDREKWGETVRHNRAMEGIGLQNAAASAGNRSNTQDQRAIQNASQLRGQYQNDPTVKSAAQLAEAYSKIKTAANDPSPAGDLSVIFGFMRLQDPSSTVREGEFATAQNTGGVPERVRAAYNKALKGERLTPAQRADFIKQADNLARSQRALLGGVNKRYSDIAARYGVNPLDVTYDPYEVVDATRPTYTPKYKENPFK